MFATLFSDWANKLADALGRNPPALDGMRLGPAGRGTNALMLQFFTWESLHDEMSWWKHLETEIPSLSKMGFTQIWLPPTNKAMEPTGRGYDSYDLWDLGEFEQKGTVATRWGTREELLKATEVAKKHGIDIIVDAVLNHKLGADRVETFQVIPVDPQNRNQDLTAAREIEGWTAFDFPGRGNKYSSMRWTQEHFTGVDWDDRKKLKGVYRIVGDGHKGWSDWVDKTELGNYDFLLGIDIDHRHPDVRADFLAWAPWILQTMGSSGFRLDAIKHIDRRFLFDFISKAREGKPDMFCVSEYWSAQLSLILPYIRALKGQTAFFDVPLHFNFHTASKAGAAYDLRGILSNTILSERPGDAVTFVDNHDSVIGQTLESWVDKSFKTQAYALIMLLGRGHPCAFYGDLYPNQECGDVDVARDLRIVVRARTEFAYGETTEYFKAGGRNCIGFVRLGEEEKGKKGCAVVVSNAKENVSSTIRMHVGSNRVNTVMENLLDPLSGTVQIDGEGWGTFTCIGSLAQIWVAQGA